VPDDESHLVVMNAITSFSNEQTKLKEEILASDYEVIDKSITESLLLEYGYLLTTNNVNVDEFKQMKVDQQYELIESIRMKKIEEERE